MKLWTISVLLLLLICLTVPFVTAEKGGVSDIGKAKKTPIAIDIKPVDNLAYAKVAIGWKADTSVQVWINGKHEATLPDDSPIKDIQVTQECLAQWPYGTLQWYRCEVS